MLNDVNTVGMVAGHWSVSVKTVRRLIKKGAFPCLRLNGAIRIGRQAILDYEAKCTSFGDTATASGMSDTAPDLESALAQGLQTAARQKFTSVDS